MPPPTEESDQRMTEPNAINNTVDLSTYLQRKYERTFNEPWSALEERVLARHPEYVEFMLLWKPMEIKKWWQIWK